MIRDQPARGQTTQDFATGIGVFLLTVAFVFVTIGTIGVPFESGVGGAETAQADRIADRIVETASDSGSNELDGDAYENQFRDENLAESLGLRAEGTDDSDLAFDRVNITVTAVGSDSQIDNSDIGVTYDDGQTAASSARIVMFDDSGPIESGDCDPACRLVVRVW